MKKSCVFKGRNLRFLLHSFKLLLIYTVFLGFMSLELNTVKLSSGEL